jgi:DNA uptake protein ComE-like DNA-binding protein
MYQRAQPFFPRNEKLAKKIQSLQEKAQRKQEPQYLESDRHIPKQPHDHVDGDYQDDYEPADDAEDSFVYRPRKKTAHKVKVAVFKDESKTQLIGPPSPRTQQLLDIINTRDIAQIRALKGVGNKKAEAIVSSLCEMDEGDENAFIRDLVQLGGLKGVGAKTVENMRMGLAFPA